jgi:hypothetical protein
MAPFSLRYLPFGLPASKIGVMDTGYLALIWIATLLALAYLFFAIYTIIVLVDFKEKLRKRFVALSVVYAEKKDVLLSLYALYAKAKLPLDGEMKLAKKGVVELQTEAEDETMASAIVAELSAFQRRLALLGEEERYIQQSPDYVSYMNSLKDLDNNYHRIIAAYNTDLAGYEYWRKRMIYRWLTWLLGFRKRERLA